MGKVILMNTLNNEVLWLSLHFLSQLIFRFQEMNHHLIAVRAVPSQMRTVLCSASWHIWAVPQSMPPAVRWRPSAWWVSSEGSASCPWMSHCLCQVFPKALSGKRNGLRFSFTVYAKYTNIQKKKKLCPAIATLSYAIYCKFRLLDPNSSSEIANYPIYKILFCVRGHDGTPESDCFAFTESHYNTEIFRIHVFRCQIREAVSFVCVLFSLLFHLHLS